MLSSLKITYSASGLVKRTLLLTASQKKAGNPECLTF